MLPIQSYPLPDTVRETPFQMEISLIHVNISHKRVTSTWFSELLQCLQLLKNNQLKIINMPKRQLLGWQIILPYTTMPSLDYPHPMAQPWNFLKDNQGLTLFVSYVSRIIFLNWWISNKVVFFIYLVCFFCLFCYASGKKVKLAPITYYILVRSRCLMIILL